jgi:hypothetical protein
MVLYIKSGLWSYVLKKLDRRLLVRGTATPLDVVPLLASPWRHRRSLVGTSLFGRLMFIRGAL